MSEYQVTVYRTVYQSTVITVDSDRPLTDTERGWIKMKAEYLAEVAELSDLDWDNLDVQIEYNETQVKVV